MSHRNPEHGRRSTRVAAKSDLLEITAKQYAHGTAPLKDLLRAAIEYANAVNPPLATTTQDEAAEETGT